MNVFRNYVFYALLLVLSFSVSCTHERERNDLVLRNVVKDVDGNKNEALASQEGWKAYSEVGIPGHHPEANNATEFTAVPSSWCVPSNSGTYGQSAMFWAVSQNHADEAYFHCIYYNSPIVHRNRAYKELSIPVRCIQD